MNEAREEVSRYARGLANPSTTVEVVMTRVERPGAEALETGKEVLTLLEIERIALAQAWTMLKQDLQEKGKDDGIMGPAPETFESVISTAENAQNEMNNRKRLGGGKPRDYYNKFCQKVYLHRDMFDIFPNTNEYVSAFCGSIKTLIKASVNYIQISEGLSRAFDEITDVVDFAKREAEMIPTQYTRIALAKLYKEIFLYLKDCIDWFTKTSKARAFRSFNQDFYERFADRMNCIKDIAKTIHQEATIGGIQSLQVMLARTEDLEQQRRKQWDQEMVHWRMEREHMMEGNIQKQILQSFERRFLEILDRESGLRARGMLEDIWHTDRWQRQRTRSIETSQIEFLTLQEKEEEKGVAALDSEPQKTDPEPMFVGRRKYGRSDIWASSKGLENFILGNSVDLLNTLPPASFASTPIAMKLREWLQSQTSAVLWIQGPPVRHYPTELSELAGSLITAASSSKAPIMFHFCEPLKVGEITSGLSVEEAGLISLVYSLIRQLILLLDSEVSTDINFSAYRFLSLETPTDNWKEALSLLSDLLTMAPGVLHCVIDGIDGLDYGRGYEKCVEFLAMIREREFSSTKEGLIFKILFTSTSYSKTLDDGLGMDEVVIDRALRQTNGKRPGPGQKLIFDGTI